MCLFSSLWGVPQGLKPGQDHGDHRDIFIPVNATGTYAFGTAPHYKKIARSQCPLISMTWERQWTGVVQRCQSHPEEAFCITDGTGRTALHLASFNSGCPVYVAQALLHANPHAVLVQDAEGWTPLHCLCAFRGGTDRLVSLYCEQIKCMERVCAQIHTHEGSLSPLFLACKRDAPFESLKAILSCSQNGLNEWIAPRIGRETYWSPSTSRADDPSPLAQLVQGREGIFESIDQGGQQEMKRLALQCCSSSESCQDLSNHCPANGEGIDLWKKCLLLLYEGSATSGVSLVSLLSALEIPVPSLLKIGLRIFPEQALQRDGNGLLPLHHVILHRSLSSKEMIRTILLKEPASAIVPLPNGTFPLLVAIEKGIGWREGLKDLVVAGPDILLIRDFSSGLYPALVAASLDIQLDTIFRLIRLCPELMRQCT